MPPAAVHASPRAELLGGGGSGCVYGEGDGCADVAEGNELILKLQQKSRENKAKNELELYEKTTAMLGYDDFMIASGKVMVRTDASGKFKALTTEEYYAAKKAGRISPGDNGIENLDFVASSSAAPAAKSASQSYDDAKARLMANQIEGVIFKAPSGMTALYVSDNKVTSFTFDKEWKREEFYTMCEKRGVTNNLKDVLAGNDALAGR